MPKNNMNNRTYTMEQKEALMSKLLSPNNMTIPELSAQCGIPPSTLYGWKSRALQKVANTNVKTPNNKAIPSNNKLKVIVETYTLSEFDLAKYCRQNGFYIDEVKKWRSDLESALRNEPNSVKEVKEELYEEKKKNKDLEKELNRKEKALAETAALLVLQKKFKAFMEEREN